MEKITQNPAKSGKEGLDNAFMDLAAGRFDLMISDKAPAAFWLTTPEGQGFEIKGKEIDVNDKMGISFVKVTTAFRI